MITNFITNFVHCLLARKYHSMWSYAQGMVGSEGLPMATQFVSLPYHEERCLRLMKEVEDAAGFLPLIKRQWQAAIAPSIAVPAT